MVGSFVTNIPSNKADAFIVVGIALTVWFFGLYYGGGLARMLVRDHRLGWGRVTRMAGVLLLAVFLLWQVHVAWLFLLLLFLLIASVAVWLPRRLNDKVFKDHLKASIYLALAIGFWFLGLVMISLVLTGWQTAALTLGLASFGACAWLADQDWRDWADLTRYGQRTIAIAWDAAFLALGVVLIGALIATS